LIRQIYLTGDHYAMGQQHARQVRDLRPLILAALEHRLELIAEIEIKAKPFLIELQTRWKESAQPTMNMLRGMADELDFNWDRFFTYTVATYLMDRAEHIPSEAQGCTIWAAAHRMTKMGTPILAKNRDYWPDHQQLQCLAFAKPQTGYAYLYLTSAGSPGVFSSGMNEAGLVVADTHVVSLDIGPGIPRYACMMDVLENCASVQSALEYLQSVSHSGNGNIMLLDSSGDMAVLETGYSVIGIDRPDSGFLVSTNHYVTPPLKQSWLPRGPEEIHGNSLTRYEHVLQELQKKAGEIDLDWAMQLMSSHGDSLESLCRHPEIGPRSVTIASTIYLPRQKQLYLANGLPCQVPYQVYSLGEKPAW